MTTLHRLLEALGLRAGDQSGLREFAEKAGFSITELRQLDAINLYPTGERLDRILRAAGVSDTELRLRMGCLDHDLVDAIRRHAHEVERVIRPAQRVAAPSKNLRPSLTTELGVLYQADCLDVLESLADDTLDLIFADPPFNLRKLYPSGIDDDLRAERYIEWCERWIYECARTLREGGSFFLWNLPKWNALLSSVVSRRLKFRHWISVDIKYSLPILGRLYPSHYSLLYFVKGDRPRTFKPDRLPMEVCPNCAFDLRDYGGYKDKMNPAGVNLSDVWYDIPPVRHQKYKRRVGANELSLKLMDRIVEMASSEGDLIFDPFGGGGTTYVVAELKRRRWIGAELGPLDDIKRRFQHLEEESEYLSRLRRDLNMLFTDATLRERIKRGFWTTESVREKKKRAAEAVNAQLDLD